MQSTVQTTAKPARRMARVLALLAAPFLALALAQTAQAAQPQAMAFQVAEQADCGASRCFTATGAIGPGTAQDFSAFIRQNPDARGGVLLINSTGGDLVQALKLGLSVRRAGLSTLVAKTGQCASACAYAFLGGVQRTLAPGARYGVHQFKPAEGQLLALQAAETQRLVGVIAEYLESVGASQGICTTALRTPANRMYWMSGAELSRYAVVTETTVVAMAAGARPTRG